jgi:cysteine desulfurase
MGLNDEDAFASIRFSLGKYNTTEDMETVIQKIKEFTQ